MKLDEPLGMNPAQGVHADAKLAGVVGNDDGVLQQPLMADRTPQRRFAGDQDGIGSDLKTGQAQRARKACPADAAADASAAQARP
jgi:hypothetical protein